MKIQAYKSIFDGFIEKDITWEQIKNLVANPKRCYLSKNVVPLWSFYNKINNCPMNTKGEFIANGQNMQSIYALMVDFDDGRTIDSFIEEFKGVKYLLYTSFRSTPELNKFRVILPLKRAIDNKYFGVPKNKQILLNQFSNCDKSTINSFRKQKIPALNPKCPENYRYHINTTGDYLAIDIDVFEVNYQESLVVTRPLRVYGDRDHSYTQVKGLFVPKELDIDDLTEISCRKELKQLDFYKRGTGVVHYTLCSVYGKLKKVGFDPWYIADIMREYAPSTSYQEIDQLTKTLK